MTHSPLPCKGTADEDEEEDEAPELFGETIDEETQTVRWGESSAEQGQTSGIELPGPCCVPLA